MDPLTESEYHRIVRVLRENELVDKASRFALITLHEPPKEFVLNWKPGSLVHRNAFVIIKKGRQTFEAIVDATSRQLVSWKLIEDVQPNILLSEEWSLAQELVRSNPAWQKAIRERGIDRMSDVVCVPLTVGQYGLEEERGLRIVKVIGFDGRGTKNYWGRPIEGLVAVVDLNNREVIKVEDTGTVPIPKGEVGFDKQTAGKFRESVSPILISQPEGPSYKVEGNVIRWQKWQFHFRVDPRLGIVISLVSYDDNGRIRSILYQGSLSELFVPYMDPDSGWYFRTYMDAGEYGIGKLSASLEPGLDCPSNTVFFDAVFADEWGHPYVRQRVVGLFERYAGDIAWRHYEAESGETEVRKRVELVLRHISTVGNYDYIFDWVFRQDGTIRIAVGVSGVAQVKAVKAKRIADDANSVKIGFGHMIAPHTIGINHDHYFCYRLDLDVDGRENSLLIDHLRTRRLGRRSLRKSVWVVDSVISPTEKAAKSRINLEKPALWRVINPTRTNPLGNPVSYQVKPGTNAVSLLTPDDFPQRRAGFTDFHLWVTPYDPFERYAAGTYPNQSKGGDGLPHWTSADRRIENSDIVVWYTLGFHHVVRAEDWPILPTVWHAFELKPFDFFEHNPALDLPE